MYLCGSGATFRDLTLPISGTLPSVDGYEGFLPFTYAARRVNDHGKITTLRCKYTTTRHRQTILGIRIYT